MWGQPAQASVSQGFGQQQSAWGAQPGAGTQTYPPAQAYQAPQPQQQRNADPYAYGQQPSSAAHGSVPGFKDPYASAGGYGAPQQVGAGSTIQYDQYGQVRPNLISTSIDVQSSYINLYQPLSTSYQPHVNLISTSYQRPVNMYQSHINLYEPLSTYINLISTLYQPASTSIDLQSTCINLYQPLSTSYQPASTSYQPQIDLYRPLSTSYQPNQPLSTSIDLISTSNQPLSTSNQPHINLYPPMSTSCQLQIDLISTSVNLHRPI